MCKELQFSRNARQLPTYFVDNFHENTIDLFHKYKPNFPKDVANEILGLLHCVFYVSLYVFFFVRVVNNFAMRENIKLIHEKKKKTEQI